MNSDGLSQQECRAIEFLIGELSKKFNIDESLISGSFDREVTGYESGGPVARNIIRLSVTKSLELSPLPVQKALADKLSEHWTNGRTRPLVTVDIPHLSIPACGIV